MADATVPATGTYRRMLLQRGISGTQRKYWIKAVNVQWDYAVGPGQNVVTGQEYTEDEQVFVTPIPKQLIGSTYKKCIYREFTAGFAAEKPRSAADKHLGILGPVIRATVGDTIQVTFKNECDFPNSVHPHGVLYDKTGEGVPMHGAAQNGFDGLVREGKTHVYNWKVPEQSGPAKGTLSSAVWLYHSHIDEVSDTNAGLVGALVVTAKGKATPDGSPKDVNREVFSFFTVFNENVSPYLQDNIASNGIELGGEHDAEVFEESNLMHSINGYVYGHGSPVSLCLGKKVRWYTLALGTEVDLHSPHWHGNNVIEGGYRKDVVSLLPGQGLMSDMQPFNPGRWLYHCHVNDHIIAGMTTVYEVKNC